MEERSALEDLPPEVLLRILDLGDNLRQSRLVSRALNSLASVLLLRAVSQRAVGRLEKQRHLLLDRGGPGSVETGLEELSHLEEEVGKIREKVEEKQISLHLLLTNQALPPAQRDQLLKLCHLHPEFLSMSAVLARIRAVENRAQPPRPMHDPLRIGGGGPGRMPPMPMPQPGGGLRDPFNPGFHPGQPDFYYGPGGAEPDPDHYLPPGGMYPGQGGIGGYPPGPMPPPGYNPDFERDRNPLGPFRPMGPGGGRAPPGPFNPGGGFGGGFGGPRYL